MGIIKFDFNIKKAYQVIKYIYNEYDNRKLDRNNLAICRIMYYADKYHINEYTRLICGGTYLVTSLGIIHEDILSIFSNKDTMNILNSVEYDPDLMSKSDIEAISMAIDKYGKYSNKELIELLCKEDEWIKNYKEDEIIIMPISDMVSDKETYNYIYNWYNENKQFKDWLENKK
jgi:uncharacterized phage-associated protein